MTMTDPLADMLTRIRNAQKARHASLKVPFSNLKKNVLDVLKREGYIADFKKTEEEKNKPVLEVELKYIDGKPVINQIDRGSKPGRRLFSSVEGLPKIYNGLGISIISTPKGVLSDQEARVENVGGEVLCYVF